MGSQSAVSQVESGASDTSVNSDISDLVSDETSSQKSRISSIIDKYKPEMVSGLFFLSTTAMDVYSTVNGLNQSGNYDYEAAPLSRNILTHYGTDGLIAMQIAMNAAFLAIYARYAYRYRNKEGENSNVGFKEWLTTFDDESVTIPLSKITGAYLTVATAKTLTYYLWTQYM